MRISNRIWYLGWSTQGARARKVPQAVVAGDRGEASYLLPSFCGAWRQFPGRLNRPCTAPKGSICFVLHKLLKSVFYPAILCPRRCLLYRPPAEKVFRKNKKVSILAEEGIDPMDS